MRKLFFWVNLRAGDLTLTRPLVRRVLELFDNVQIAYGCWQNQACLVEDLPVTVYTDPRHDPKDGMPIDSLLHLCPPDHYPIYLWAAVYPDTIHHVWPMIVEIYNRQVIAHGLNELVVRSNFTPMVDFAPVEVEVAQNAVFIENGVARSRHSDFEFDMESISNEFPLLNFYCTAKPNSQRQNVFDCSAFNLPVLSSISNRCIAIAGKGSGPMCSTLTEANRYKPRAIARYHPVEAKHSLWDYPGNPMQYIETHDDVRAFLRNVSRRKVLRLVPAEPATEYNAVQPEMPSETEAASIDLLLDQFDRNRSDAELAKVVANARNRLVEVWQSISDDDLEYAYRGAWGKLNRRFLNLGSWALTSLTQVSAPPLPPQTELKIVNGVYAPETLRRMLIRMLVSQPQEFNETVSFRNVPNWLRLDLCKYIHQFIDFFEKSGQSEHYFRLRAQAISSIAECVRIETENPYLKFLALQLVQLEFQPRYLIADGDVFSLQRDFAEIFEFCLRSWGFQVDHHIAPFDSGRKPRIGFLVDDLGNTEKTRRNLAALEHLDSDFEVRLYLLSSVQLPREISKSIRVTPAIQLPSSLYQQLEKLRQEDLDILVFGTDFTKSAQASLLGSCRIARCQLAVNSSVTSCLKNIDAILVGEDDAKYEQTERYSEEIIRLPGAGLCFASGSDSVSPTDAMQRTDFGIPADWTVYSSMACVLDVRHELLQSWTRILEAVPRSVLLLLPFDATRSNAYRQQAYFEYAAKQFIDRGIDPNRLRMVVPPIYPDFDELRKYFGVVDICLDSFPVSNLEQTIGAFRSGLPVVTKDGTQRRANFSSHLVKELAPSLAQHLVAVSEAEYVAKAVQLGTSKELRTEVGRTIQSSLAGARFSDAKAYGWHVSSVFSGILARLSRIT